jgi:hypothetical protein
MQKLVEKSLKQQQKLQHMLANMPSGMREDVVATPLEQSSARYLVLLTLSVISIFTFCDKNHAVCVPGCCLSALVSTHLQNFWTLILRLRMSQLQLPK